jgi:hypothetical protein
MIVAVVVAITIFVLLALAITICYIFFPDSSIERVFGSVGCVLTIILMGVLIGIILLIVMMPRLLNHAAFQLYQLRMDLKQATRGFSASGGAIHDILQGVKNKLSFKRNTS